MLFCNPGIYRLAWQNKPSLPTTMPNAERHKICKKKQYFKIFFGTLSFIFLHTLQQAVNQFHKPIH